MSSLVKKLVLLARHRLATTSPRFDPDWLSHFQIFPFWRLRAGRALRGSQEELPHQAGGGQQQRGAGHGQQPRQAVLGARRKTIWTFVFLGFTLWTLGDFTYLKNHIWNSRVWWPWLVYKLTKLQSQKLDLCLFIHIIYVHWLLLKKN